MRSRVTNFLSKRSNSIPKRSRKPPNFSGDRVLAVFLFQTLKDAANSWPFFLHLLALKGSQLQLGFKRWLLYSERAGAVIKRWRKARHLKFVQMTKLSKQ